jgi:hypothetical protein
MDKDGYIGTQWLFGSDKTLYTIEVWDEEGNNIVWSWDFGYGKEFNTNYSMKWFKNTVEEGGVIPKPPIVIPFHVKKHKII